MEHYSLFIVEQENPCKTCLKWERFGKDCHVYWEGKTFCTLKVNNHEEWTEEKRTLGN